MADEPRRSGRATKGQHKNLDMVSDTPGKKGRGKGHPKDKHPKPSDEPTPGPSEEPEDEEIIRCICGEYEEEEDVERDMICCDQCSAWQHNDCMGLQFAKGEEPDKYYCEKCKPENHKELLEKINRGEKPWEEVAERRRKEAEEKKPRRRKGKKGGRRGRPSEAKTETSTPTRAATSTTPAPGPSSQAPSSATLVSEKEGTAADAQSPGSQKRKFDGDQAEASPEPGPKQKQPKTSPSADERTANASKATPSEEESVAKQPAANQVKTVEEIQNPARRHVATAIVRLLVEQIHVSQKQKGIFRLPKGVTPDGFSQPLGVAIEDAMFQNHCGGSGEANEAYRTQLRTILFNVKKNASLRDRLLVGKLSPDALSKMSSQDMASEEQQQKDADIKREAERQHIITQEQGPRIRRTHKGEELVEDDSQHNVASEPVFSTAPARRSVGDADGGPGSQSPRAAQQAGDESTQNSKSRGTTQADGKSHDQHFPHRAHSPGGTSYEPVFPEMQAHIREPLPTGKVQADADIDKLLKDDEAESEPPYSPKDFHDEGSVWRGKVVMNSVSEFTSSARHVGGADLSGRIPWSQLVPPNLVIDGRIDIKLATNYLCGLRFSVSTDVTIISVSRPDSPRDKASFDKLFDYFQDRKRYGVYGKHPLTAVKDTYYIPIEAGSKTKPEFVELLENNSLEDNPTERSLLVAFVVRTGDSNPSSVAPPSHQPSQEPATSASPLTMAAETPQQGPPSFATPMRKGSYSSSTPSSLSHPQAFPPPQHPAPPATPQYPPYQPPAQPGQVALTGMPAAVQVLGPQANTPAIQTLLEQAPNADVTQLNIVRDILVRRPETASDYQLLMTEIAQATANANNPQIST